MRPSLPHPLLAALMCAGCLRAELPPSAFVDCGAGARVVVDNGAYCVYFPPERPAECPAELPYATEVDDATVCAGEPDPPPEAVAVAVNAARWQRADGGLSIQKLDVGPPADAEGNRG